jgi:hypothetical protein
MKYLAALLILLAITPDPMPLLHLPFNGRWFVMQGGDTPNVNAHMMSPAQALASTSPMSAAA